MDATSFRCARAMIRALAKNITYLMRLRLVSCLASLVFATASYADDTVTLNFVNADIEAVVKAVGEITGKNFLIDPRVKGTINIISARPVAKDLVYPTLLSALRLQGFTAVESGSITKIVPEAEAKTHGGPTGKGVGSAQGDRLITQVYTLRYESAAQLVSVLRPLITLNNAITAYSGNNSLVITDYADNLKRIEKIIQSLDQAPAGEPIVIPIRYASALDIVQLVNRLMADTPTTAAGAIDSSQRVVIVPDGRSNSVLLRSDSPGRIERVRKLIEQLDIPSRAGHNIHVLYLKNAEATKVAQTLRAALTGESSPSPAGPTQIATNPTGNPLQSPAAAPPAAVAFSAGGVTVQADAATNSLIITAPEALYHNLRSIIEKLDVRRAQVYVEALVVEVTAEKAAEFGIQWQALEGIGRGNTQGIGGTNFGNRGTGTNIIDIATNLGSAAPGLNIGVIRGQVFIPGLGTITNLGFLARALESDANANILSTPNLLTLDNEEARIVIGQNVPFVTGQYALTGSTTTPSPFQTIERRDVGLTLRVKPQISEGGTVRLAIYQEVSSVQDRTNSAGIITNKRSLESTVLVDDGQIIVLGGLIQDSLTDGADKVPILGDVPVLGNLFRYENRKRTKTNLMVFLRPYVIRSAQSSEKLTFDRYDYLLGEQNKVEPETRTYWPEDAGPRLPQLPAKSTNKP